ncbi:TetR/AcrR family transcriptional regulator [Antrihabitans sp. YC3-6]|uniref:TetR/AcrR family transcriptional regulator n=1 Tax=Antrihabitans stalagmiti TaxID=2799499 RepID=A0A934NN33_9NOCA|nr:TetR/AcrR family transcriptional regulator [Antrihabitans stalagmiti]MBJ8338271.1 TetR/AcrR family transcriptional regulator [Antrihabitans stalagmiti]
MAATTMTRDRILDAAMELFSENSFRGTSITQIETAAGLTPGAGGIYHHFRTKESILEAGLERHLDRVNAVRDITQLMSGLGDLRVALTLLAKYVLTELDNEETLLRILATDTRTRPHLLDGAVHNMVRRIYSGFASWLADEADISADRATDITSVGLGALLSARLVPLLFGLAPHDVGDEQFVKTWVDMMLRSVEGTTGGAPAR